MFDDLSQVKRRYEELAYRMTTPEAMNDPAAYAAMMREYKELTPLVEAYRSYTALQKEVDEEKALLDAPTEDAAFNDMVQQELRENWQKLEDLEQKIRLLLLPKDANDEKSIIMEIRAGAGGEEAALFAHSLHRMYTMYAARQNWACSVISLNETELGGVKEITFSIEGPGVYSRLKFESGVHRVQRVPETETQGRIHTSAATVAVMPEAEEVDVEIRPEDLRIDIYRASGAGGQQDFVMGAYLSKGGKSFICCSSSYMDKKSGQLKSRIRPTLLEGSVVTATRTNLHYVVTEYGKFNAKGKSTWERAEGLINLAHPQFREELIAAAEKMHIWRRSNKK